MSLRIDHVVYLVRDLDAAAAAFVSQHGLDSYAGGDHPAFGTGNRIVPLGDQYLELMTVTVPDVAKDNPLGQAVAARLETDEGFLAWVVRTDDIDRDAARIGRHVVPGERTRPDGTAISWRAAGIESMLEDASLPFFIAWDDPARHPALEPVAHENQPNGIAWIEIAADETRLKEWLGPDDLPVTVVGGEPGVRAVAIATARGEIVLR